MAPREFSADVHPGPVTAYGPLDAERWQADDIVGRRRDADAGLVELADNVSRHGVLGPANLVRADDEAHRQFHPVVGDAPVDAWLEVDRLHPEGRLQVRLGLDRHGVGIRRMQAGCLDQRTLHIGPVRLVGDRDRHLLPDEREVAAVVVDRLREDLRVRHRHDAASELAAPHPHGRVGTLDAREAGPSP